MQIKFALLQILRTYGKEHRGIAGDIAGALQIHRHTASKLLSGDVNTISLAKLGELCDWLITQGVPRGELPHGLLRVAPAELWQAVADTHNVTLYLGEDREVRRGENEPIRFWVSRRDSDAANAITQQLYDLSRGTGAAHGLRTTYVPFRYQGPGRAERKLFLRQDIRKAKRMYDDCIAQQSDTASLSIGSPEANYITEILIASLFGCEPFELPAKKPLVPVHMVSRHHDTSMRSCFGSIEAPPGYDGHADPGLYYMTAKGKWKGCRWEADKQDAALIVTVGNDAANTMEIAMFGFSGRATAALATHIISAPSKIWPPYHRYMGKKVGVYLFQFTLAGSSKRNAETYNTKTTKVIKLEAAVLEKYLPKARKTR